jgi:hypothetical protein
MLKTNSKSINVELWNWKQKAKYDSIKIKNWKMGFKLKELSGIVFEIDLANQP